MLLKRKILLIYASFISVKSFGPKSCPIREDTCLNLIAGIITILALLVLVALVF